MDIKLTRGSAMLKEMQVLVQVPQMAAAQPRHNTCDMQQLVTQFAHSTCSRGL